MKPSLFPFPELIKSQNGPHISIYINKLNDKNILGRKLNYALTTVKNLIKNSLNPEMYHELIIKLMESEKKISLLLPCHAIGVFISKDQFKLIPISLVVDDKVVVANSFHIKPLLLCPMINPVENDGLQLLKRYVQSDHLVKNIFAVSKAIIRQEISHLYVAADSNIYGIIDDRTGGLKINPCQIDEYDDDILDDFAQRVLRQGGQVTVLEKQNILNGRDIVAISTKPVKKKDDLWYPYGALA